jgi:hypothetical protein
MFDQIRVDYLILYMHQQSCERLFTEQPVGYSFGGVSQMLVEVTMFIQLNVTDELFKIYKRI